MSPCRTIGHAPDSTLIALRVTPGVTPESLRVYFGVTPETSPGGLPRVPACAAPVYRPAGPTQEQSTGLWTGEPVGYQGEHYQLEEVTFLPRPAQQPRIPIWVAAMWPQRRPVRGAARWDGIAPITYDIRKEEFFESTLDVLGEIADYVADHRTGKEPFDFAFTGIFRPDGNLRQWHADLAERGVTWWRYTWDPESGVEHGAWLADVLKGPPRR